MNDTIADVWIKLVECVLDQCGDVRYLLVGNQAHSAVEQLSKIGIRAQSCLSLDKLPIPQSFDCVIALITKADFKNLRDKLTQLRNATNDVLVLAAQDVDEDVTALRTTVENFAFAYGLRKYRKYYSLLGDALQQHHHTTLLIPLEIASKQTSETVGPLNAVIVDQLRQSGLPSDNEAARYQMAAVFIRPGDTVLDCYCGSGYGLHILNATSPGRNYIGLDTLGEAITYAKSEYSSTRVEFRVPTTKNLLADLADQSIDFVLSIKPLANIAAYTDIYDGLVRVLRPGGRALIAMQPLQLTLFQKDMIVENLWHQHGRDTPLPIPLDAEIEHSADGVYLALAMRSPLSDKKTLYRETLHTYPEAAGHLLAYAESYENPWLGHALIEIPYRLQNKTALLSLAWEVFNTASLGSADSGAALAVIGYQLLESKAGSDDIESFIARITQYLSNAASTMHAQRWCISLAYLGARLAIARNDTSQAMEFFTQCAQRDSVSITPTLATKTVEASIWLGRLQWQQGSRELARKTWGIGVALAESALHADWSEFYGNLDSPLLFSMNDAVEIIDKATQCARLLFDTGPYGKEPELALWRISQTSLRGALTHAQQLANKRYEEIKLLETRLNEEHAALVEAQALALDRHAQLTQLDLRLHQGHAALAAAQRSASDHNNSLTQLNTQLDATQHALEETQQLAFARAHEIELLHDKLAETETARQSISKNHTELQTHLNHVEQALLIAQNLALTRFDELQKSNSELNKTHAALAEAQNLAKERFHAQLRLEERLNETNKALALAQTLAFDRFDELQQASTELHKTHAALAEAQKLATDRFIALQELDRQLYETNKALAISQNLALARFDELEKANAQLDQTHLALNEAQGLAIERYEQISLLNKTLLQNETNLQTFQTLALQQESELISLKNRVFIQTNELKLAHDAASIWQENYHAVVRSKSWRWTRPARSLLQLLTRNKNRSNKIGRI